jgi:hypothetical protein
VFGKQEVIPVEVGGLRAYRDPRFLCFGGLVPESYYKSNDDSYVQVAVAAGAAYVHRVEVAQAGSTLAWDFFTAENDIRFGVYYVPAGTSEDTRELHQALVPLDRVNAHTDRCAPSSIGAAALQWLTWSRTRADVPARSQYGQHGGGRPCGQVPSGVGQQLLVDDGQDAQLQDRSDSPGRDGLSVDLVGQSVRAWT